MVAGIRMFFSLALENTNVCPHILHVLELNV